MVAARRGLLDALDALGPHRGAVVLVGAQAVYAHTGGGDLPVAPMTTDADLALRAGDLPKVPELSAALTGAGFELAGQPGRWRGSAGVCVDLMVVPHQSGRVGKSARAALLPPHMKGVARITRGLEPALIDHRISSVGAIDPADHRIHRIGVAGPSALLAAKLIKLNERLDQPHRLRGGKDALDIYRILREVETEDLVAGFASHATEPHSASLSAEAVEVLRTHGIRPDCRLAAMASQALGGDPVVAASFAALAGELVGRLDNRTGPS